MTPPLRKRLKRRLRAAALRVLLAVLAWLPLGAALALGRGLGAAAHALAPRERELARAQLRQAFPDADEAFVIRTARACFVALGEHLLENVCVHRVDDRLGEWVRLEAADRAVLDEALSAGRGVIVVTGHLGNWELAARALVRAGYEVVAAARESHDPGLGALVEGFRAGGGVKTLYRGRRASEIGILRQLRKGGSLFLLVDVDTDVPSVFVPFFGRPAKTPRAPADLSLRTGAALVAGFIHREGPGRGHRLRFVRLPVADSGSREADVLAVTQAVNGALEAEIRARPESWVWFHRRWRSAPEEGLAPVAASPPAT